MDIRVLNVGKNMEADGLQDGTSLVKSEDRGFRVCSRMQTAEIRMIRMMWQDAS